MNGLIKKLTIVGLLVALAAFPVLVAQANRVKPTWLSTILLQLANS